MFESPIRFRDNITKIIVIVIGGLNTFILLTVDNKLKLTAGVLIVFIPFFVFFQSIFYGLCPIIKAFHHSILATLIITSTIKFTPFNFEPYHLMFSRFT